MTFSSNLMSAFKTTLAALLMSTSLVAPATARDTVVGLSTQQSKDMLKEQIEQVIAHLIETLQPGETARIFDASKVQLVATLTGPKDGSGNTRKFLNANRRSLAALKRMIDAAEAVPGRVGGIDFPGFLRAVRQNFNVGDKGADLIVFGNRIFDDPMAPSVSFRNGRIPNDDYILAGAGQSPFGTSGLPGSLAGYDVYFGYTSEPQVVSEPHAYHLDRLWTVQVEGHQASMAYVGDDLETLFTLAGRDAPDQKHEIPLAATGKLEMLRFAPDTGDVAGLFKLPPVETPAPDPIWRSASNVTIGATWECTECDIDLYVRPNPSAKVIYFNQSETTEGQLYKDFTNSPESGFETVALTGADIDLSRLTLALNFYDGRARQGRIVGELRLAIGSQVWAVPFRIEASTGNKGAGAEAVLVEGTIPNSRWLLIDPMSVLNGE